MKVGLGFAVGPNLQVIARSTALRYVALSYNYSYYIFPPNISYNSIYSDKSVYLRIYTILYDASKYCHRRRQINTVQHYNLNLN